VKELTSVLALCEEDANVVVLSGTETTFCIGADFRAIGAHVSGSEAGKWNADALYELWHALSAGSFVSIAHVRGKAAAGGVGFVSACDMVLAGDQARFGLSEMLFGVQPACVLPYLIRRVGFQRAHFLTLSTQFIDVHQAASWGLVDAHSTDSEDLLRRILLRVRHLSKASIRRYKKYVRSLDESVEGAKESAVAANIAAFSDPEALSGIVRYVDKGLFPWEDPAP
jgi:polyketide biosynthesis enoyl-CoA hydratase PksH